jgi:hypothetical protein
MTPFEWSHLSVGHDSKVNEFKEPNFLDLRSMTTGQRPTERGALVGKSQTCRASEWQSHRLRNFFLDLRRTSR